MTIQYSIQKMVSDGTLSTIALGIQYLQRNAIYMRIAGVDTPQSGAPSGYTWSFVNNTTLKILPGVPNGVEVVVYRRTDVDAMYNIYSQSAQFDEATIDENNQQLLYIAQEYLEQGIPGAGVATIEFLRDDGINTYYRIKRTDGSYSDEFSVPSAGSATKTLAREALRRSYAEAGYNLVAGSFEAGGTLVNANDVLLHEADGTAYNWDGVFPGGGKAVPPGSTPASTGGVVAGAWHPVGDITLREELAGLGGAALVGASSYAGIRSYTGSARKIHCYGQSNVFDRAHGDFVLDEADVASVDNGGTILVDALGRRWKRQFSGAMKLHWFGAKGDRVADDTPSLIEAFGAVTALGRGCIEGEPGDKYRITHTIFYGSNTVFDGRGCEVYHDSNTTNGSAFMPEKFQQETEKNYNIKFKDFTLNTSTTGGNGIAGANARRVTVENVHSDYLYWHLFDGAGCQDFTIKDCHSYNCRTAPYQCDNATYSAASEASDAAGNVLPIAFDASGYVGKSRNVTILNCRANGAALYGVHFHNTDNNNVIIQNCIFEDCANGVFSDSSADFYNVGANISNNIFIRCTVPINLNGQFRSLAIRNNYFFGDNTDSHYYGILTNQPTAGANLQQSISGNQFVGIIRPIILGEIVGVTVTDNEFFACGGTVTPASAASVEGAYASSIVALMGCSDYRVSRNTFVNCLMPVCISLDNGLITTSKTCDNGQVMENITRGSGALLSSHGATRLTVAHNNYVGLANDYHGVYIEGGLEPIVHNNKIDCGGGNGVSVVGSALCNVRDNVLRSAVETGTPIVIKNTSIARTSHNTVISGFTGPQVLLDGTSTGALLDEPFCTVGKAGTATGTKVVYTTAAI